MVGVCSYLLVSFWFTRIAANQSSLSAILTNRVGDCFLTIGMFVILWSLGNLDYSTVFSLAPYVNENAITIIGICLLIGAMAKSSQVGLHIWLPMAMEGPTPVSALIHAATMVTAGVYLLIRSSPLIEYSSTVLLICLWLGAITTVFSSLIGLFQQDIKKIIAYSTMSQLGMMVIAIGLSSYNIAIFHLINHAFYKGLLFLGAGAVIHAVVDNQDLRKYGGLRLYLPLTYTVILIASLSLVAFPFMTGFYSKDFILESAYGQYYFSGVAVYAIAVIGAIFTTLYSVKVLYLTFLTNPNGSLNYYRNSQGLESDIFISLPLVILAQFSIYFGYITKDIYIGLGSGFFADNSIFIHPMHEILIDTEFGVATIFKLIPLIFTLFFSGIAIIYSEFIPNVISKFKLSNLGYNIFGFFNQRFLVEFFYNKFIVNKVLYLGSQTTQVLDKGSIELIGPYGMSVISIKVSKTISRLSKGIITDYALNILTGVCLYLTIFTYLSVFVDLTYSVTISCLFILILSGSSLYTHHLKQLEEQNSSQFVRSFVYTEECFAGNKNHQLNSSFPPFKGGLVLASKKFLKYLLKFGICLLISNLLGFVWNDSIFMDGDGDSESEKPKDKGKGKLIEDTPKGQSSEEQKWAEYDKLVKNSKAKRELELFQELLKFEGENLAKEKEHFLKTGEIPAHSLHTVAAETAAQDVGELSRLERDMGGLDITADDGDTSNKRRLADILPQHAGESEDLGGPSVKKTKYESSSESEDLGGPSVKKKKKTKHDSSSES